MPSFSKRSEMKLMTCHPDIIKICREVIKHTDFTVLCGHRKRLEQDDAFAQGRSKLKWPDSKHNQDPSSAIDIAPWPIDWNDLTRFHRLAGMMQGTALSMGIELRWGGDFNGFFDGPHFELVF